MVLNYFCEIDKESYFEVRNRNYFTHWSPFFVVLGVLNLRATCFVQNSKYNSFVVSVIIQNLKLINHKFKIVSYE